MASVMTKAAKGNRAALTRLYDQTKAETYFLVQQLLRDDDKAADITAKAYSQAMQLPVLATLATEQDFARTVQVAAVELCKTALTRQNAKALRLPADRRFDIRTVCTEGDDNTAKVFANFSDLQRVIFVLNAVSVLSADQILHVTKLDRRTMQDALAAEEENINKILPDSSYASFIEEFAKRIKNVIVPDDTDKAVAAAIGEIVAPVEKEKKKRTLKAVLITVGVCVLLAGMAALVIWDANRPTTNNDSSSDTTTTTNPAQASAGTKTELAITTHYADIDIQNYGTVTVALDSTTAPETVYNFVMLAEEGFYDGLTFHRIMEGFMMQGGDPLGNGTGGSDTNVTGEFGANGIENPLSHVRGAISMARATEYNSASSQFFIVHQDSTFLDGDYAAFGYVTEGMDIVDAICTDAEPTDDNGTIPAAEQPIINSITIRSAV